MIVKMFQPRFAPLVLRGIKRQTVRPRPKRMPKIGDVLSLREWTGKPYRSKQRILRTATVKGVHWVDIGAGELILDGFQMPEIERERFARADGFKDWAELEGWFRETHSLPFEGIAIFW